jgi:hypothetical protein
MTTAQIAEYIGYLASLFLIISLIVSGDIKFRIYNSLGCIAFIIYGACLNVWPVILTNALLLGINIIYLSKQFNYKEKFEIVEIENDDKFLQKFLSFYGDDIKTFLPKFDGSNLTGNYTFVVLRDLVIANVFSAKILDNGDAQVALNYTTKKYRDYKVSKFIFEKEKSNLLAKGIKRIVYDKTQQQAFKKLLGLNGFLQEGDLYVKSL